eukprot:784424-Alexandrium_andersonii.AAC.1
MCIRDSAQLDHGGPQPHQSPESAKHWRPAVQRPAMGVPREALPPQGSGLKLGASKACQIPGPGED